MAFSFGSPAPAFGAAASTPAFGAASTPAFGLSAGTTTSFSFGSAPAATSAPAGTSSFSFNTASAFGASSASLFGQSTAPSLFGATSTPASTPSLFGATPATATTNLFGASSTPSMFGATAAPATTSPFNFGTAASYPSAWAGTTGLAQPQQPVIMYSTKYEDLPAPVQQELQNIQREISAYRDDCDRLSRDQRLHDSTALKKTLEEETQALKRSLEALSNGIKADDEALADFREKVMRLLRCTESAVRTYQRAKLWRTAPQQFKGQLIPPQVQELLASPVVLPNPYLEQAVAGFTEALDSYRQVVCALEAALPPDALALGRSGAAGDMPIATALPVIVSHMHDYFVHVAAHLEQLHTQVERAKSAFLAQRQAAGDMTNLFADARRHQHHTSSNRPVVIPPASAGHHHMAQGHGVGYQLHAGTAHGPGGTPMPGAFGTPLATPMGQQTPATAGSGDPSKKQAKSNKRR